MNQQDKWRQEMASLQAWIDADEAGVEEAKAVIREAEKRIKALRKKIEKRREGWQLIYRAYIRGEEQMPPHMPELFGPDPEEAGAEPEKDEAGVPGDSPDLDRSEAIDDELHEALFPPDREPVWKKFRDAGGISDAAVDVVLSGLWPDRIAFRCDSEDGPGHSVRGGAAPAFWLGDIGPGKLPPPDLMGAELADAVRRALHLAKLADPEPVKPAKVHTPATRADEAPVRARKGSARGPAAGAVAS